MYDIGAAIIAINPSAKVVVWDEDYEQIKWNDTPVISKSDIQAKIEELKAEKQGWKSTEGRRSEDFERGITFNGLPGRMLL